MRKKVTLLCLLFVFVSSFAFSSDIGFLFGGIGMHPEYLGNIGPTYVNLGASKDDFNFVKDNTTELQLYLGGGFEQRQLWNHVTTGDQISNSYNLNLIRADWKLRLKQGFYNDMLTASLAYDGIFEYFQDKDGIVASPIYPDLDSNNNLGTYFTAGLEFDWMNDDMFVQDGILVDTKFSLGPKAFNSAVGYSSFHSVNAEVDLAKTIVLSQAQETGRNLFSLVLVDRFVANYTNGDGVPTYFRKSISLGRKVRGFNSYYYNHKLTFVNNLDIRVSLYEIDEISFARVFPRFNFFFDVGYGMLDYVNTSVGADSTDKLLASTGVQATICISDFVNLGYQYAYIIKGTSLDKTGQTRSSVGSVVFILDF